MKQEKIDYCEIMALGFTEEKQYDSCYFNTYGFEYAIIEKKLTDKIYLDWEKESRTCKLIRIDSQEDCNIMAEKSIKDLKHLKEIINFFLSEEENYKP